MNTGVDAKHFIYLPIWAKILCLALLAVGIAASVGIVIRFFDGAGNTDWLLIGISGAQFLITTFVIATVLFVSQTDANIGNLRKRTEQFLEDILPAALAKVSPDDAAASGCDVTKGSRRDIFGYDYLLSRGEQQVIRVWCGLNVSRLIVIYRVINPKPEVALPEFVERLKAIFHFSLGGAEAVGYKVSYEPLASSKNTVSIWLNVSTEKEFLTDPALKLFWSQDLAMMTESFLRTALRHQDEVRLDLATVPRPQ